MASSTGRAVCAVAAESRYVRPSRASAGNSAWTGSTRAMGLCRGCRLDLLADPAVALLLEHGDELGAALLDDPALEHDVHELGLDEVQDALVVRDDQDAERVALVDRVDRRRDRAQRVDVEAGVGLVEHRE